MSFVISCFSDLEDPRASNSRHRLGDLIVMMLAASICGAACATEFALFARERRAALSQLIDYEVAPSHDTFSRLLRLLEPVGFGQALARLAEGFAAAVAAAGGPQVVALDGKALRRAYERGHVASPPLAVSAFAARARLCLAACAPGPDENEVEAALKVVGMLDLAGHLVTADALHCHHRMAEALSAKGADYLLALKGNRPDWLKAAKAAFATADETPDLSHEEIAHDRREVRRVWVRPAAAPLTAGHQAFVKLVSQRNGGRPVTRFFLASRPFAPDEALAVARAHWQIENALHWMLDVHLGEDTVRRRKDHAAANTAIITRLARNILQHCETGNTPISHRIKKCAWNDNYLVAALTHMQ